MEQDEQQPAAAQAFQWLDFAHGEPEGQSAR